MIPKYAVYPGKIGEHFISGKELISLYKVNPAECVIITRGNKHHGSGSAGLGLVQLRQMIPLLPRADGNYSLEGKK